MGSGIDRHQTILSVGAQACNYRPSRNNVLNEAVTIIDLYSNNICDLNLLLWSKKWCHAIVKIMLNSNLISEFRYSWAASSGLHIDLGGKILMQSLVTVAFSVFKSLIINIGRKLIGQVSLFSGDQTHKNTRGLREIFQVTSDADNASVTKRVNHIIWRINCLTGDVWAVSI